MAKTTKDMVSSIINDAVRNSKLNNFKVIDLPEEPMWYMPIIGFAAGDDELFEYYKKEIGDFYWTPKEAFELKYKPETQVEDIKSNSSIIENAYKSDKNKTEVRAEDLTVISFAFAQTAETKKVQREAVGMPSLKWMVTRGEWEPFIYDICDKVVSELEAAGVRAVAIDRIPEWSRMTSEKFGIASKWSHRHTAYIAGLGTFGLSDGLITKQGKAMRFCSIIIEDKLEADKRPYEKYNEWCLFYSEGKCGVCIGRCPVDAISKDGHDKETCSLYLQKIKKELGPELLTKSNWISGCGLCQSKIPCQDKVPTKSKE